MQPPAVSRQQHKQQQHQTGSSETLKRGTALIASRHSSPWGLTKKNLAGGAAELGAPDGLEHQKERSLSEGEPESMDSYVPTIRTRPPYCVMICVRCMQARTRIHVYGARISSSAHRGGCSYLKSYTAAHTKFSTVLSLILNFRYSCVPVPR